MNAPLLGMIGLGPMELCIVAGVALLLFGNRLPQVAKSLGQSVFELKKGLNEAIDGDQQK